MLGRLVDAIFGYDYFISYSHSDGKEYPKRLTEQLQRAGYRVFLDAQVYSAGDDLNVVTRRRVRMSRYLVVIGRPSALQSSWVLREVRVALERRTRVVVIDVNRTFSSGETPLVAALKDHLRISDDVSGPDEGPSDHVLSELGRSFRGRRQDTFRLRIATALLGLLAGLALLSYAQYQRAASNADARLRALQGRLRLQARADWVRGQSVSALTALHDPDLSEYTATDLFLLSRILPTVRPVETIRSPYSSRSARCVSALHGFAAVAVGSQTIAVVDLSGETPTRSIELSPSTDYVRSLSLSDDGTIVVAEVRHASHQASWEIRDVRTGARLCPDQRPPPGSNDDRVALSVAGNRTAIWRTAGAAQAFDIATGRSKYEVLLDEGARLTAGATHTLLATPQEIRVIETATGREAASLQVAGSLFEGMLPDSSGVVTATRRNVRGYAMNGARLWEFPVESDVSGMRILPECRRLFVTCASRSYCFEMSDELSLAWSLPTSGLAATDNYGRLLLEEQTPAGVSSGSKIHLRDAEQDVSLSTLEVPFQLGVDELGMSKRGKRVFLLCSLVGFTAGQHGTDAHLFIFAPDHAHTWPWEASPDDRRADAIEALAQSKLESRVDHPVSPPSKRVVSLWDYQEACNVDSDSFAGFNRDEGTFVVRGRHWGTGLYNPILGVERASGERVWEFHLSRGENRDNPIVWNPKRTEVAVNALASGRRVIGTPAVINVSTGVMTRLAYDLEALDLAWSAGGDMLVTLALRNDAYEACVWERETGELLHMRTLASRQALGQRSYGATSFIRIEPTGDKINWGVDGVIVGQLEVPMATGVTTEPRRLIEEALTLAGRVQTSDD